MRLITLFIILTAGVFTYGQSVDGSALTEKDVSFAEEKLYKLGFWIKRRAPDTDESTRYAVLAFQRITGVKQTGILSAKEITMLKTAKPVVPRYIGRSHIEVDLKKQILFFVNESGKVSYILPVSTGTGKKFTEGGRTRRAITPKGNFKVFRKVEDWKESPLGNMYYPNYIVGGVAIHGSNAFPNRPSTYGCIKVPIIFAPELSYLMPFNTMVMVY